MKKQNEKPKQQLPVKDRAIHTGQLRTGRAIGRPRQGIEVKADGVMRLAHLHD